MIVTLLQTDIYWKDAGKNIGAVERLLEKAPKSDLYVLPEMWNTGFVMQPQDVAESEDGAALTWMRRKAQELNAAFCGSIAFDNGELTIDNGQLTVENGQRKDYRNRLFFVYPDGSYVHYDKHHLFRYGGEDQWYTRGNKRVVVNYKGWRLLLLVCYDLRYPKWARYDDDYDAIVLVANWPLARQNAWDILPRARAIENQCYFIGCNRVGTDDRCTYIGRSCILDFKGFDVAVAKTEQEEIITAELSLAEQKRFNKKFGGLEKEERDR